MHILIIEESAEVRADIRRMLLPGSDGRYRITEAQSGADGLRACREATGDSLPDCVLIGYHLPDMDAAEVLAQLRNQSELPPCPVVVLTGPNGRVGNSILRAGAQEYIGTSWLTPETLTRVIEDVIERFNLIAERFGDAVPLFDEIGNVRGPTGVFTAITDRKRAEEARQEITAKYERQARVFDATLSAITDFAYIFDLEGRFLYANKALLNLWGLTLEEAVGKNFFDLNYPEDLAAKLQGQIQQVVATRERLSDETFYTSPTGAVGYYEYILSPVLATDGIVEAVAGSTRNITERQRTEAALIDARKNAEAANQSKDSFLAVLSHELRTPLTPVLMVVAMLEHDFDLRPAVREQLAMIKRNIQLITKLIDGLLDLSRVISGKVELDIQAVDFNEIVRHICESCRSQMREKNIRLELEFHDPRALIAADPARLQQVLTNVLMNAIKFTPEKGTILIKTARQGDGRLEVRVRDSGAGIPAAVLPRIFDAFEQGSTKITRQFGGLGLGLAISKALVELHHGSIRAESAGPGLGSTFIIELPGKPMQIAETIPHAAPTESGEQAPMRLLLVEDHDDTARAISRLLRFAGFRVTTAFDIASAVAAAEREPFDVLISDIGLPDGDGCEIMSRIRAIGNMPGIAISGYGMDEDGRRSREAGFAEHLVKPIDVPQLIAAIRRVTG